MLDIKKSLKENLTISAEENKAKLGNYYFQYYEDFPKLIETGKLHVYHLEGGLTVDQYYENSTKIEEEAKKNINDVYEIRNVLE